MRSTEIEGMIWEPYRLTASVGLPSLNQRCLRYMTTLGLRYASFDFAVANGRTPSLIHTCGLRSMQALTGLFRSTRIRSRRCCLAPS